MTNFRKKKTHNVNLLKGRISLPKNLWNVRKKKLKTGSFWKIIFSMNAQRRHIQTDRRTDTPIDQTMPFYCMCPETFKKKRLTQIFRNQKQDKNVEMKTKNGKADETHNEVKIYEKDLQFKTKPIPCLRLLLRQFSRARGSPVTCSGLPIYTIACQGSYEGQRRTLWILFLELQSNNASRVIWNRFYVWEKTTMTLTDREDHLNFN